ncbi:MAG: hypothetical protein R3F56_14330 [Planctomycetota bacterium]
MKRSLVLTALGALMLGASPVTAQLLSSTAFTYAGNRMTIGLKLTGAQIGASVGVSVSAATGLTFAAPATVTVDTRGYVGFGIDVTSSQANLPPRRFTVTLSHASFSGGQIQRDYIVKSVNGAIGSAWPDILMIQGVFCNPPASAATNLEIDRATDLDGNGYYGDVNIESIGADPLDSAAELSTDINLAATATGCFSGTPANVWQPGSTNRNVAFCADARVVTGACAFTSIMNFVQDMSFAPNFGGTPALLFTSDGSDQAFIGRDANGDGNIGPTELQVFFDPNVLINAENYSPDGIAYDPTGTRRAYWISDKSGTTGSPTNQGVFRLTDSNGDDQIGAGEFSAVWTGTTPVVQVESQNVDHTEFECLHVDSYGAVLVNQTSLGTIFRWLDGNSNGIAETGEVSNWLTYAATSTFTQSADFQTAGFPSIAGPYFALNLIESVTAAGFASGDVYYIASTNSQTAGQGNGFIFRCEDLNLDGDVNDLGEVTVFSDPSMLADPTRPEFTSGMDVGTIDLNGNGTIERDEQFVYVADADGNNPRPSCGFTTFADLTVWRFVDKNGDGDAVDAGEAEMVMIHPTGAFNRGLEIVPDSLSGGFRHTFYSRSGMVTLKPAVCSTGGGETIEIDFKREKLEEGTQGTPFAGNQRFELQTRGNDASAIAAGVLLSATLSPAPFPYNGCNVWTGFPFFADLIPPTAPNAAGVATFPLPVPNGAFSNLILQGFAVSPSLSIKIGEAAEFRVR